MSSVYDVAHQIFEGATSPNAINQYEYNFARLVGGTQHYAKPIVPPLPEPVALGWSSSGQHYSSAEGYPVVGHAGSPAQSVTLTDCSGFTAYVIERVAPQLYDAFCGAVNLGHGEPWPSAADYATAPAEKLQNVFEVIGDETTLAGVVGGSSAPAPGDFLAWSAPPGANDTGHVMVIAATLEPVPNSPSTWYVTVYDSSGVHIDDTRTPGHHGVGCGKVVISYDPHRPSGTPWVVSLGHPLNQPASAAPSTPPVIPPAPQPVSSQPNWALTQYQFFNAPHLAVVRLRA